jgi:hypothetical protein
MAISYHDSCLTDLEGCSFPPKPEGGLPLSCLTFRATWFLSYATLLLLAIAHIGWPFSLYKLLSLTSKTVALFELDPLGMINAYPSQNKTSYPFFSITETESTLLLSCCTHSTFVTLNMPPDSIRNNTIPDPCTTFLVPIPSSTYRFESDSVKLSNNSRAPVI